MADTRSVLKTVYSVADFLDWQRSGTLDLRPYFQRNSVWTKSAKSYFIDTLVKGFPVPLLLLQSQTNSKTFKSVRRVVDGQQRLRTVLAYVDPACLSDYEERDEFVLMGTHNRELAGRTFSDLPDELQQRILDTEFSVHVLGSGYRREQILEVFARMNSTGRRLNKQELRNAEYHGELKQLVYELSYENLENWTNWGSFTVNQIAEMKDVEFTSELVFYVLTGLRGKSNSALDALYKKYDLSFPKRDEVAKRVRGTLKKLQEMLTAGGESIKYPKFGKQGWLYVLFAIVHDSKFGDPLDEGKGQVNRGFDLNELDLAARHAGLSGRLPEEVLKASRGAATDVGSRRARLHYLVNGR